MNNDKNLEKYKIALEYSKYEGQLQWQVFSAFLIAHTVFMAFLLRYAFTNNPLLANDLPVFIAGILGLLMCIPWAACYYRNRGYYELRLAQAKKIEPDDINLVKGKDIEKFSNGEHMIVDDKCLRIGWIGRIFRTKRSIPFLILIFVAFYLSAAIIKAPWWS